MAENLEPNANTVTEQSGAPTPSVEEPSNPQPQVTESNPTPNTQQQEGISNEDQQSGESFLDVYKQTDDQNSGEQGQQDQTPVEYKFTREDGQEASPEETQAFNEISNDLKLNQEQAQKLYNIANQKVNEMNLNRLNQAKAAWEKAITVDAELGGVNLNQTKRNVALAMKRFGTDNFKDLLIRTGLGSHPEMVRVFNKIGSAIGNDQTFINGNTRAKPKENPYPLYEGVSNIVQE